MSETKSRWLCTALVLIALLPLWIGRYPPLYDYPAHLLEAQVLIRYDDPGLGYAEGYRLNAGWPFGSNALATLLTAGLALALPIELAGRLVLSLYLTICISGLWRLLQRANAAWPLLLLGPLLAWNIGFSSGWVNFSIGLALGLHLLASFLAWIDNPRRGQLVRIALLVGLIAAAHTLTWGLWAVVIAALAASGGLAQRRALALLGALIAPLAIALAATPTIAATAALIPIFTWLVSWAARRANFAPGVLVLAAVPLSVGAYLLAVAGLPWLRHYDPELSYNNAERALFLVRTFTLAQQTTSINQALMLINGLLLALLALLGGVLALSALRRAGLVREPWLAALAALIMIYGLSPSGSADLVVIEPRVLIVAALISLSFIGLPQRASLRRLVAGLATALCVAWLAGACLLTLDYNRQAQNWQADLDLLGPARRVLSFRVEGPSASRRSMALSRLSRSYDGSYFSSYRFIERGGYTTRLFGNGPIWLRDEVPGWVFYLPQPADAPGHFEEQCRLTLTNFDAVLLWGVPGNQINPMLSACLGPPMRRGNVLVWMLGDK